MGCFLKYLFNNLMRLLKSLKYNLKSMPTKISETITIKKKTEKLERPTYLDRHLQHVCSNFCRVEE